MAAPAWAAELISIVRLHTLRGTLVQGWEALQGRLKELGLASEQQVLGEFKRCRGPACSIIVHILYTFICKPYTRIMCASARAAAQISRTQRARRARPGAMRTLRYARQEP